MTYSSGTAGSLATLLSAIQDAAVGAGWTLSGSILSKAGAAFKLTVVGTQIEIEGGLGVSGSTVTTPCTGKARLAASYVTLPVSYEIFTFSNPDEVYVVIKYDVQFYQQLSFGRSSVAGNEGSPWFTAACNDLAVPAGAVSALNLITSFAKIRTLYYPPSGNNSVGLFVKPDSTVSRGTSFFYNKASPTGWKSDILPAPATGMRIGSSDLIAGLLNQLPSLLTGATVLVPIKSGCDAGSKGFMVGVNLNNARFCRIDNLNAGQVVQYGGVSWKVYPWLRKNLDFRNGQVSSTIAIDHSGTYGYAIRYEGP